LDVLDTVEPVSTELRVSFDNLGGSTDDGADNACIIWLAYFDRFDTDNPLDEPLLLASSDNERGSGRSIAWFD
jgi:hypothetical protein